MNKCIYVSYLLSPVHRATCPTHRNSLDSATVRHCEISRHLDILQSEACLNTALNNRYIRAPTARSCLLASPTTFERTHIRTRPPPRLSYPDTFAQTTQQQLEPHGALSTASVAQAYNVRRAKSSSVRRRGVAWYLKHLQC